MSVLLSHAGSEQSSSAPAIRWPDYIHPVALGDSNVINGIPVRMWMFVTEESPSVVARDFRQSLTTVVDNHLGNELVLGQLQGDYYVTVQIGSTGIGSKGVVAISEINRQVRSHKHVDSAFSRWEKSLPGESHIVHRIESQDDRKVTSQIVYFNRHGERLNEEHLMGMLASDRFQLEKVGNADGHPDGKAYFWSRPGVDAIATITKEDDGLTYVVLTATSSDGRVS